MANLHYHDAGVISANIPIGVGDQRAFVQLFFQTKSQKIGEEEMEVCLKADTLTFGIFNCKEGGHFIHKRESGVGWSSDAFAWSASADPLGNQSVSWVWTLDRWQDGHVFRRSWHIFFVSRQIGFSPFQRSLCSIWRRVRVRSPIILPQKVLPADDVQKWSIQIEFSVARFRSFWPWPLVRGSFPRPLIYTESFSLVPPALAVGTLAKSEAVLVATTL
ncbi:hypothetical protein R1flu_023321 [Riccia fluitans]|uniref:Uncharacterized protein n=1 Tax=Riccia fluitans TaxID=41844 RepID=A0ABD1XRQ4_9MARC